MRIAIDVNGVTETSGLGNYIKLLVSNLAALDHKNEYLLYQHQWRPHSHKDLEGILPRQSNFKLLSHRLPNLISLYSEYTLGIPLVELFLRNYGIDVYHGPSNIVPRFKTIKSVVTIHHYTSVADRLFQQDPRHFRENLYFDFTEKAAQSATHIITVSEHTKRSLIQELSVSSQKISVVYPGGPLPACKKIEHPVLPPALAAKLSGKFILFCGPLNARKNLPVLLEAFSSIKEKLSAHKIAITTHPSSSYRQAISSLAEKLSLSSRLVFLGDVSNQEMALLYNKAECLVYSSLSEGFGSPPLEAMACGCPVLCSNVTAIPEVVGDAAFLVSPTDKEALAAALLKITTDPVLRRDLVAKGLKRVKKFSWPGMTKDTLELYKNIADLSENRGAE
ncbi:MAG: glycosyltransferase family 4 protein [Elusimicrobia bacterium]|nr:glycosyltransferase family 4 protein [Elusimicrobiota bacterium]